MGSIRVCFSHRTALQIMRTVPSHACNVGRGAARKLPERSLGAAELAETIERVKLRYRGVCMEMPVHVLVSDSSQRRLSSDCREHVHAAPLTASSLFRLMEGVHVTAPAATLVQIASRESDAVALLELIYELCGTYQTQRTGVASAYDVAPLVSVGRLRDYCAANPSLKGARKTARILRYAADRSASARETKQALVLGLPHKYGGYGLGIPRMNFEVRANAAARAITGKCAFRCDLCWPEAKLDVEYQSRFAHEGEASRIGDSRRTNALEAMGWKVVCITNDELDSLAATDTIANTIRRHLGKRAQVHVADHHARKLKLRRQLGLPIGFD